MKHALHSSRVSLQMCPDGLDRVCAITQSTMRFHQLGQMSAFVACRSKKEREGSIQLHP